MSVYFQVEEATHSVTHSESSSNKTRFLQGVGMMTNHDGSGDDSD